MEAGFLVVVLSLFIIIVGVSLLEPEEKGSWPFKMAIILMVVIGILLTAITFYNCGVGNVPAKNFPKPALKAGQLYVTMSAVKDPVEGMGYVVVLLSENGWLVRRLDARPPATFIVTKDGRYVPISPKDYRPPKK